MKCGQLEIRTSRHPGRLSPRLSHRTFGQLDHARVDPCRCIGAVSGMTSAVVSYCPEGGVTARFIVRHFDQVFGSLALRPHCVCVTTVDSFENTTLCGAAGSVGV